MASLEAMVGDYPVVFIMDNAPIHNSIRETYAKKILSSALSEGGVCKSLPRTGPVSYFAI